ncbi:hypothetical protein H4582DRAFT_2087714 [Lactarius indigo]|nr:hypothetical protein H4582DRAFT_2087714 [Lactarius indigo]
MTIYYSLTFLLLASEMISFCVFVAPLPFKVRRKLFRLPFLRALILPRFAYGLKISCIFVGILFCGRPSNACSASITEIETAKSGVTRAHARYTHGDFSRSSGNSTPNAMFTSPASACSSSLVLTRTFYIIQDLIDTQDEFAKLKKAQFTEYLVAGEQTKEIERLKQDLETLSSKARSQAAEYDRLADQYNK